MLVDKARNRRLYNGALIQNRKLWCSAKGGGQSMETKIYLFHILSCWNPWTFYSDFFFAFVSSASFYLFFFFSWCWRPTFLWLLLLLSINWCLCLCLHWGSSAWTCAHTHLVLFRLRQNEKKSHRATPRLIAVHRCRSSRCYLAHRQKCSPKGIH